MTDATAVDSSSPDASSDAPLDAFSDAPPDAAPDVAAGCADASIQCGSTCVGAQQDPHNCGSCGHDCELGTCAAGKCQGFLFADGQDSTITSMVVSSTHVYWVAGLLQDVWRCPLSGCQQPEHIFGPARVDTVLIAVAEPDLYIATFTVTGPQPSTGQGEVIRCASSSCATFSNTQTLLETKPISMSADDAEVAWADANFYLFGCGGGGCAQFGSTTLQVQHSDQKLYLSGIYECTHVDCMTKRFIGGTGGLFLTVDHGEAIWSDTTNGIGRCSTASCNSTEWLTLIPKDQTRLAANLGYLYWVYAGRVYRCDRTTCSSVEVVESQPIAAPGLLATTERGSAFWVATGGQHPQIWKVVE